jgi:hypothetical protein
VVSDAAASGLCLADRYAASCNWLARFPKAKAPAAGATEDNALALQS